MAGKAKRKNPETTTQYIVGMIDTSVYVEKYANKSVQRPYYSGVLQSALLLTALAAELSLKLAYENENPIALKGHAYAEGGKLRYISKRNCA